MIAIKVTGNNTEKALFSTKVVRNRGNELIEAHSKVVTNRMKARYSNGEITRILSKVDRSRPASFQTLTNKELESNAITSCKEQELTDFKSGLRRGNSNLDNKEQELITPKIAPDSTRMAAKVAKSCEALIQKLMNRVCISVAEKPDQIKEEQKNLKGQNE